MGCPPQKQMYMLNVSSDHEDAPYHMLGPSALWGGLREKTSAHGIPHVDNARGKFNRLTFFSHTHTHIVLEL